ncbi:hypothetical protein Aduo_009425 [Ancylostoma duodenale]
MNLALGDMQEVTHLCQRCATTTDFRYKVILITTVFPGELVEETLEIYAAVSAGTMSYLLALLIDIFLTRPIRCLLDREELHRYGPAQAD